MVGEGSRYNSSAGGLQKSSLYPAHYPWLFSARLYLQGQKVSNHLLNYGKREKSFRRVSGSTQGLSSTSQQGYQSAREKIGNI